LTHDEGAAGRLAPPSISVVVEGYNATLDIGCLDDTIEALRRQTFPTAEVELILAGSDAQVAVWETRFAALPFHSVRFLHAGQSHYYELKNRGVRMARAPIVALTDSDVAPDTDWLSSIVEGLRSGHRAVAVVSLFRSAGRTPSAVLEAAASISWVFIVGPPGGGPARGFLSHNLGFHADVFEQRGYRADLGRTCAGSFLFSDWRARGIAVGFQPRQRVRHAFNLRWWVSRLHVRFGHEVYSLRRIHREQQMRWVRYLGPVEPLATSVWHVLLDVPQWWRFGRLLGHGPVARLARLPLVIALSIAARGGELAGMYFTMFAPEAARSFAEQN
jgi:glycosyltransferase involved in cell wall biosynthesis